VIATIHIERSGEVRVMDENALVRPLDAINSLHHPAHIALRPQMTIPK